MTAIVDQMFPPINRKWAPEYTDFNYWRVPVPEYELPEALSAPPSPALSASVRSDASSLTTLSRLRQFSLGRSRSSRTTSVSSSPSASGSAFRVTGHVRAASSLDRLLDSRDYVDDTGQGRDDGRGVFVSMEFGEDSRPGRLRDRPTGSMFGSRADTIEDSLRRMRDPQWFGDRVVQGIEGEDEDEEGGQDDHEELEDDGGAEEAAEEAFDDDLLATGEMENVPFL